MTSVIERPRTVEHHIPTQGLLSVDLPEHFGPKYSGTSADWWTPSNGSVVLVRTDRVEVDGHEGVVPGIGQVDLAISQFHLNNLAKLGIIRNPVIGKPHPNVEIRRQARELPGEFAFSAGGSGNEIVLNKDEVKDMPYGALDVAEGIFDYGKKVHNDIGLTLKGAIIRLGVDDNYRYTVTNALFSPSSSQVVTEEGSAYPLETSNDPIENRKIQSLELYRRFTGRSGLSGASSSEVASAVTRYYQGT